MNDISNIRALSIQQPWPNAILTEGKDVENRDWPTAYRGPFLIHAGMKTDGDEGKLYPRGGIVGIAEITGCVTASDSRWFVGKFGFTLANARPLDLIPCKGQLGFFRPSPDVLEQVRRQLEGQNG